VLGMDIQGLDFNNMDDVTSFANDVKSKTSEEEQAVLMTLLKERGQWHPEAESLLNDVVERPSSRRMADSGVNKHCDAGEDETMCGAQVDSQCAKCVFDKFRKKCRENTCDDYKAKAACCANAVKIPTGCFWNPDSERCFEKSCKTVGNRKGRMTDDAVTNTLCKEQPGCSLVCETENGAKTGMSKGAGECLVKGDYTCKSENGKTTAELKNAPTADLGSLMGALGGNSANCNILDCSQCLKSDDCAAKQLSVKAGGTCNKRCSAIAPSKEAVECLFCGQKAAGCVAKQATPFTSCDAVATTDIIKVEPEAKCAAACATAKAACPNQAGEMKCIDKGKGATSGAAGLTAAVVGLLAPVFAFVLAENFMM